jgi:hypothetical protein
VAANMRLPSARASLLKMAAAYDDLAKMLSPVARSQGRREFSQREQAESRNCREHFQVAQACFARYPQDNLRWR